MVLRELARVEDLESRRLLSITLEDGVLRVVGTDAHDYLLVRQEGDTVRAEHRVDRTKRSNWFEDEVVESKEFTLSPDAPLRRIVVYGLGGDDVIDLYRSRPWKTGAKNWPWALHSALRGNTTADARLVGGGGDDEIRGGSGFTKVSAGRGDDRVTVGGGLGDDPVGNLVHLGPGDDHASGGSGADTVYGGSGRDLIEGGSVGPDVLRGGGGDDFLRVSSNDRARGGNGEDMFEMCMAADEPPAIIGDSIELVLECYGPRWELYPHPRYDRW